MTRRKAIQLLKTEKQINCLDPQSYITFLALRVEVGCMDTRIPLAKLVKAYDRIIMEQF